MSFRFNAPKTHPLKSFNIPSFGMDISNTNTPVYHHETKDIGAVKVELLFPFGRQNQENAFQALAATELLLSGADGKTEREIFSKLEHWGASVSNECHSLYSTLQIRCSKNVFLDVFNWVTMHLRKSDYPELEVDRYKAIKIASLQRKMQTAGFWANKIARQHYYQNIQWESGDADIEDFEKITPTHLLEFHKKHIKNPAAAMFFSGDIDANMVGEAVEAWQKNNPPKFVWSVPKEPDVLTQELIKPIEHHMDKSSQVSMNWMKHIGIVNEETQHRLSILNMVFGGYFGSRLMQDLREKQGLTYGISSFFRPFWKGRTWEISGEMNSDNKDKAIQGVANAMVDLQNTPIPHNELERAKTYYLGMFRSGFDGPFASANKASTSLVREYSANFYNHSIDIIRSIQPKELIALAQKELDPNSFIKVVAGKINS